MRKYLLVLSFLIGCLFLSCSKDSSPTNVGLQSSLTLRDTVALMNYPFEKNGVASGESWNLRGKGMKPSPPVLFGKPVEEISEKLFAAFPVVLMSLLSE